MKFSLKTLAAAVVTAVAASGASAAIDNGATGDGEFFFNIWDTTGSYTRDLNVSISSFETQVSAAGFIHLTYAADPLLLNFLSGNAGGTRSGSPLLFNVFANDNSGAGANSRRMFMPYSEPFVSPTITSTAARNGNSNAIAFINSVNGVLGLPANAGQDSIAALNAENAAAGKAWRGTSQGALNFQNTGTTTGPLASNSYATGRSFMFVGAHSTNASQSTYNQLFDQGQEIRVYLDQANTLHIQAVPEPETYAMLLAGLGMLGFMARRRLNNRV